MSEKMPDRIWLSAEAIMDFAINDATEAYKERDDYFPTEYIRADLVPRWISVQERLPEDDRDILMVRIISGKQTYCIGHYDHSSRCFMFRGYTVNVTHWQALPTYPQEG